MAPTQRQRRRAGCLAIFGESFSSLTSLGASLPGQERSSRQAGRVRAEDAAVLLNFGLNNNSSSFLSNTFFTPRNFIVSLGKWIASKKKFTSCAIG